MINKEDLQNAVNELNDLAALAIGNLSERGGADNYTFLDGEPVSNKEFKLILSQRLKDIGRRLYGAKNE